jgi:hypothetical protein
MTMPAEITSDASWDRLIVTLRTQYADIDELYQSITEPDLDVGETDTPEGKQPMPDPGTYPYRGYDPDAELDDEQRVRLDAETDSRLDGDDDLDPADDPDLDA